MVKGIGPQLVEEESSPSLHLPSPIVVKEIEDVVDVVVAGVELMEAMEQLTPGGGDLPSLEDLIQGDDVSE